MTEIENYAPKVDLVVSASLPLPPDTLEVTGSIPMGNYKKLD